MNGNVSREPGDAVGGDAGRDEVRPQIAGADEARIEIVRTDDVDAVRALGIANGLEEGEREGKVRMGVWEARDARGALVGGICLERSGDLDSLDWMSVNAEYRGHGIASRLLGEAEREARARGVRRLWVTARASGFFAASGYRPVDPGPEADYLLGECPSCEQYGHGCTPRPMMKDLD